MAEKATKKPNIFKRAGKAIARFFRETKSEMKKVVWPSRKQVINNLTIVLVFIVIFAVLIVGLDIVFAWLTNLLFGAFRSK